jgi:hypothetical protein
MLSVAITFLARHAFAASIDEQHQRLSAKSHRRVHFDAGRPAVVFPDGSDEEYLARMLPLLEKAVVERVADDG